jgi:hypothetical protein
MYDYVLETLQKKHFVHTVQKRGTLQDKTPLLTLANPVTRQPSYP